MRRVATRQNQPRRPRGTARPAPPPSYRPILLLEYPVTYLGSKRRPPAAPAPSSLPVPMHPLHPLHYTSTQQRLYNNNRLNRRATKLSMRRPPQGEEGDEGEDEDEDEGDETRATAAR